MQVPKNSFEIGILKQQDVLYEKLVVQLNKDFSRIGYTTDTPFKKTDTPEVLVLLLKQKIAELIHTNTEAYFNLLYIIDVSETKIKRLKSINTNEFITQISFLILQREWQKVSFKNKL